MELGIEFLAAMSNVNTLEARIALAMLSLITIGVFILGIVFFFTYDHMEHKLLEMLDSYATQNLNDAEHENIVYQKLCHSLALT